MPRTARPSARTRCADQEAYGWDPDAQFLCPEVASHFARLRRAGPEAEAEWNGRAERYRADHQDAWAELSLVIEAACPTGGTPRFRSSAQRTA